MSHGPSSGLRLETARESGALLGAVTPTFNALRSAATPKPNRRLFRLGLGGLQCFMQVHVRWGDNGRSSSSQEFPRQQKTIAFSSAEAELCAMTACSSELLGMQACAQDLGISMSVAIYSDASAALGIVQRRGIGRVRHIRTQSLWLQEAHAQRRIAFEKVDGSRNW